MRSKRNYELLLKTWKEIPNVLQGGEHGFISLEQMLRNYMDLFHFGDGFYAVFDTRNAHIDYVHSNVEKILGYDRSNFQFSFFLDCIHPEDIPYCLHYEQNAVRFFSDLPEDLKDCYKFSYDYRIRNAQGTYVRLLQQTIPVEYFENGGVKTLVVLTDITHLNINGIPKLSFIGISESAPSYYNAHLDDAFRLSKKVFTKRESEILKYVADGMTSYNIADQLHLSIHTVNTHRKNILLKSGCDSVGELLVKSIREGWL